MDIKWTGPERPLTRRVLRLKNIRVWLSARLVPVIGITYSLIDEVQERFPLWEVVTENDKFDMCAHAIFTVRSLD